MEEDRMALYFSAQNSRVYHEKELMGIDISENVHFSSIIIILYYSTIKFTVNIHRMLRPLTISSNPIQSLLQLTAYHSKKVVLLMTR